LGACIQQVIRETLPGALFSQPPQIRFVPRATVCRCGRKLKMQKTRVKKVFSLNATFIAKETVRDCRHCKSAYGSEDLLRLVAGRCNVGWDVLVFVGRSLFQRQLTTEQVVWELQNRHVSLSASEVGYLGRKFIGYLALGHRRATPNIRQAMDKTGGYVLHLDAAHDADSPALMTGMDSLSRFVLANVKVPSENADCISAFLERLRADYGTPIACVHDMGTGICKAVDYVFAGIPDFICHFHFLRDIGKDFLGPAYNQLRACLRKYGASSFLSTLVRQSRGLLLDEQTGALQIVKAITAQSPESRKTLLPALSAYSLSLWCLQAKRSGDGYGFPFDRPLMAFSERLVALMEQLPDLVMLLPARGRVGNRTFYNLAEKLIEIGQDPLFHTCVQDLSKRCKIFDRLRKAMRIAQSGESNGLNDDESDPDMASICAEVRAPRQSRGLEYVNRSKRLVDH
jgi:hypothetical protein